jgi:predicted amidohydrolase
VVLPEVFACRGNREALLRGAEPIGGRITQWLAREAALRHCWILGGSLVEREGERCFNTSLLFNRAGKLSAAYRKLHLFDATLADGREVRESLLYTAGDKPCLVDIEGWRCGLSICYDLRFPELYRHYLAEGATVLLVPANFTDETGRAHWEVLVRARAIENQCFVIAPDQCGRDPHSGVKSHGHSLIVDPWGRILAQADEAPAVLDATLQPSVCDAVRRTLPAWRHRRPGSYT